LHMLVTYHGVLVPAAGYRHRVVPPPSLPDAKDPEGCRHHAEERRPAKAGEACVHDDAPPPKAEPRQPFVLHAPAKPHRPRKRYSWAERLRRVFAHPINCNSRRGGDRGHPGDASLPSAVRERRQ
jgi:hypothetical protein